MLAWLHKLYRSLTGKQEEKEIVKTYFVKIISKGAGKIPTQVSLTDDSGTIDGFTTKDITEGFAIVTGKLIEEKGTKRMEIESVKLTEQK